MDDVLLEHHASFPCVVEQEKVLGGDSPTVACWNSCTYEAPSQDFLFPLVTSRYLPPTFSDFSQAQDIFG